MKHVWMVSLLLVAGCLPKDPPAKVDPPQPLPNGYMQKVNGQAPLENWLSDFADPTLNALVQEALTQNFNLQTGFHRLEAAKAQARVAGAALWPTLTAGADGNKQRQNFIGLGIPGAPSVIRSRSESYGVSVNLSWELDLWGKLDAAKQSAAAKVEAQSILHEGAKLSLAGQIAKAYFAVTAAQAQMQNSQAQTLNRKQARDIFQGRFQTGTTPATELQRLEKERANAAAQTQTYALVFDAAKRQLQSMLGRYPNAQMKNTAKLKLPPRNPPVGKPADLLSQRPDLAAAQFTLQAAGWDVKEAKAALFPSLTLSPSAGIRTDKVHRLFNSAYGIWSLAGQLSAPIFEAGRLQNTVEAKEAMARAALTDYAALVQNALRETETYLAADTLHAKQVAHLQKALQTAKARHTFLQKRYQANQTQATEVLNGQNEIYRTQAMLISAKEAALANRVDLHLALGGPIALPSKKQDLKRK